MSGLGDQEISEFGDSLLTPTTAQQFFGEALPFAQGSPAPPLTPGVLATLLGAPLGQVPAAPYSSSGQAGAPAEAEAGSAAAQASLLLSGQVKQENSEDERELEFDVAALTVDELREELRLRGLATSGPRATLTQRLLEGVKDDPSMSLERLGQGTQPVKKRKRNNNKREPTRDEFETEAQYLAAWHKWRETRDNNNESVKRSRDNAKMKRKDHEQLCLQREGENQELLKEVINLREQVSCLSKVLEAPDSLTSKEQEIVRAILDPVDGLGSALDPPRGP